MFGKLSVLCAAAVSLVGPASAVTVGPVGDLVVSNKVIAPDGIPRSSVLAGGTFPGPVISGKKVGSRDLRNAPMIDLKPQGDRFTLNVTNSLTDPTMLRATTIHWHGIFQNGTNIADGPAMVTQCPIIPDDYFVYDFNVYDQAGTFWYHSHYSTQYCDGLRGAFVIYDDDDPYQDLYDIDDESTIITLADWYREVAPEKPAQPLTTLINGLGRTLNGTTSELAVINVESDKTYRFRLIGLSCDAPYNFTIHNHKMTIVETDGEYTAPIVVDSLWVYAGQRYSVIVHANQPVNNYWIRADPLSTRGPSGFDGGRNSAIFRYVGANTTEEPKTNGISARPLNEDNLHALVHPEPPGCPEPGGADMVIPIRQRYHEDTKLFDINNVTYTSPSVPVLLQILNGTYDAEDLMPKGSVYKLKPNSSIELQFHGLSRGGPHAFYVVKNAHSPSFNWANPVIRDTVTTGFDNNLTVIRFFTDNSGPWFLHCHTDWHIDLGLAIVFAEDPEGMQAHQKPIPPPFFELCPKFNKSNPDLELGSQKESVLVKSGKNETYRVGVKNQTPMSHRIPATL
ncbi:hypothetical protein DXG01_012436 [Tephrocybe rancida]|nr:hypothetical protein DXG01_012436 [Tephrocybe rancida]